MSSADDLAEFEGKIEALLMWITKQSAGHQTIFSYFYNGLLKLNNPRNLESETPRSLVLALKEIAYDKRNAQCDETGAASIIGNVEAAMNMYGRFDVDALLANNGVLIGVSASKSMNDGLLWERRMWDHKIQYSFPSSKQADAQCILVESFIAMSRHRG